MLENKAMIYSEDYGLHATKYADSSSFIHNMVGGYIELVPNTYFDKKGIDVWCNEEGKFMNLKPCVALAHQGKIFDIVVGNIVFTRCNDEGETVSLTDEDIEYINNWYDTCDWHISADMTMMIPVIDY